MKNMKLWSTIKVIAFALVTFNASAINNEYKYLNVKSNPSVKNAAGGVPEFDFDDSFTLPVYTAVENQATPIFLDLRLDTSGGGGSGGGSIILTHSPSFTINFSQSTLPDLNWTCSAITGGTDCNTPGLILGFTQIDFQLAFDSVATPNDYQVTAVVTPTTPGETDVSNNSITTTFSVMAGPTPPDLDFIDSATAATYDGVVGQQAPILIDYSIENLGAEATDGVSLSINWDDFSFPFNGSASTLNGWNCFPITGQIDCFSPGPVATGSITNLQLAFNVDFNATSGSSLISATLNDDGGLESNFSNNNINTNINLVAANPDLLMNLIVPATNPVSVEEGVTASTPFTFRVENVGNTVFLPGDVDVFIDHDFQFTTANIQTLVTGWTCSPETSGTRCVNTSSSVLPFDQIDISGEITSYPSVPMLYSGAVTTVITDLTSTEINLGNNSNNLDVDIFASVVDTDIVLTKFTKDGPSAASIINADWPVGTNYYYHIHVDNISPVAADMVDVTDSLPAGVQFVSDLSIGGWSCSADPFMDEFTEQNVICSYPSIPGNSPNFSEFIVLEVSPLNTGVKNNTAFASTLTNDSNPINNSNPLPATINIVNPVNDPDVDIDKSFLSGVIFDKLGATANQNSEVVYKILVNNNDMLADNAANVIITDTLPADVTFLSFNEVGPNFDGNCIFTAGTGPSGEVTCSAVSLPFTAAEDGVEITVNVTGATGAFIDNTATVAADNDSTLGNNTSNSGPFQVVDQGLLVDLIMDKESQTLAGVPENNFSVNENFNYVLTVSNLGLDDAPISEVVVSDIMPIGIDIINITSAVDWDCSNSDLAGGGIDCFNTVELDSSTSSEIIIEVSSQSPGNYDNVASVDLDIISTAIDTDINNNSDNAIVDILAVSGGLVFTKDIAGAVENGGVFEVAVGDTFQYLLKVENNSIGNAYNDLVLTDSIDVSSLSVQSVSSDLAGFDCSAVGNDITCSQNGSTPLGSGEQTIVTIEVFANAVGTNLDNTANVQSVATNEDIDSNTITVNVLSLLNNQVDLDLLKDAQTLGGSTSKENFLVGESFEYKIVVHNTGPDEAPIGTVEINDSLPIGIDLDAIPASIDWDCSATVGTLVKCVNLVSVPASTGFLTLIIPVSSQSEGSYLNSADVSIVVGANVDDIDLSNNNGSKNVIITQASGDFTLMKSVTGGSNSGTRQLSKKRKLNKRLLGNTNFAIGDTVFYTLIAENNSAINSVNDVVITDPIDTSFLSFDGFNIIQSAANFSCSIDGMNVFTCTNASGAAMNPGERFEVEILATAIASGNSISNTANLSSASTGDDINSNTVLIDIDSVAMVTTLSVDKQAVVDGNNVVSVTKGTAFTYKILVQNTGFNDAINVSIIDNMPVGVVVNSASGPNWSCTNVGQEYTCDLSTSLLAGTDTFVEFNVMDNSSVGVNQLQNVVDATADNALLVSDVNDLDLTQVSLNLNVSQNPDPIVEDSLFELIVNIENTGSEDIESAQIINTLPAGFSYSSQNRGSTCSTTGLVMTCNFANPIPPGITETTVISVNSVPLINPNENYQNVTTLTGSNFPSVITSNTDINVIQADSINYSMTLVDSADPVNVGVPFEYDIAIVNSGGLPITSLNFDLDLSSDLSLISTNPNLITCTNTASGLSCQSTNALNVLPGTSLNVLNLEVNSPTFAGSVTSSLSAMVEGISEQASESTLILDGTSTDADLTIVKTASVSSIVVNGNFDYILTVENNSGIIANAVEVSDVLPTGLVLNSIEAPGWVCSGKASIICNVDSLAANTTSIITINVDAPSSPSEIINTAQVSMDGTDPNNANNASQVAVDVVLESQSSSNLSISKTASAEFVTSGESFNWNIEISNLGPNTAENVVVTDQLPSGFEFTSAMINGVDACNVNDQTLICNIGDLNSTDSQLLTILGSASIDSGTLQNTVTIESDTADFDIKNNLDTASILVNPINETSADLFVDIVTQENVVESGVSQFSVNPGNNGPDSAVTPTLNMVGSGQVSEIFVDAGSDWSCQVNSLMINCNYSGKEMPNGQQSAILVKLIADMVTDQEQTFGLMATMSSETSDPDESNNSDSAESQTLGGPPTELEILAAMQAALAGIGNQQTFQAIENVASYCGNRYEAALDGLCTSLYNAAVNGEGELLNEVMEQITPNEVIGQSSSVSEIATAQFRNVGARLSQLRGGGGSGFSTAGLNARYGNGSIPLGMLAYLNESADEDSNSIDTDTDFISPWGFFVNGTISMGERDATGRELGFDFDSFGLTAGVDYRLDASKVLGVALGYANFDSKIQDSAELNSTGVTLTGYGSFYVNDNFYIDSRISIAKPKFDQSRDIKFEIDDISIDRTANGKTNANQYSFAMSAGYHFNKNAWNITPNASVNYVRTDIDGFEETGAGAYNFIYSDQEVESLVWSAGMKASKAISLKNGVITPQFDLDYNYESLNDGSDITARFIMAPDDEIFIIATDSPDRSYGSAGLGLVYVTANGKQAYINYRSLFGLDGFSRGTFNLGARFEF